MDAPLYSPPALVRDTLYLVTANRLYRPLTPQIDAFIPSIHALVTFRPHVGHGLPTIDVADCRATHRCGEKGDS